MLGRPRVTDFDVGIPREVLLAAAALRRGMRSRVIDQHLAHHPRHQRQKMGAVRSVRLAVMEELHEGLIHQRRWLQ